MKGTVTTKRRDDSTTGTKCITLECGALNSFEMTINKEAGCFINGINVDEYYSNEGTTITNDNHQTRLSFENGKAKGVTVSRYIAHWG